MAIKTPAKYKEMEFLSLMQVMVHLLKPKVYVEIGVKKAYTFNAIAPLVEKAYGIDTNKECENYIRYPNAEDIDKIIFCHGDSELFVDSIPNFDEEFIDFLFIDGDHKYESVLKDFYTMVPYVKTHTGIIFMHDTYPVKEELLSDGYCSNAWKAASEIHENFPFEFEIVTIPGPWAGLSIARKLGENSSNACHGWMDKEKKDG